MKNSLLHGRSLVSGPSALALCRRCHQPLQHPAVSQCQNQVLCRETLRQTQDSRDDNVQHLLPQRPVEALVAAGSGSAHSCPEWPRPVGHQEQPWLKWTDSSMSPRAADTICSFTWSLRTGQTKRTRFQAEAASVPHHPMECHEQPRRDPPAQGRVQRGLTALLCRGGSRGEESGGSSCICYCQSASFASTRDSQTCSALECI